MGRQPNAAALPTQPALKVLYELRGAHAKHLGQDDDRGEPWLPIASLESVDRGGVETGTGAKLLAA